MDMDSMRLYRLFRGPDRHRRCPGTADGRYVRLCAGRTADGGHYFRSQFRVFHHQRLDHAGLSGLSLRGRDDAPVDGSGLIIGAWVSWTVLARRLRRYTIATDNSLTLPEFFEKRFGDTTGILRSLSSFISLYFITLYVCSGLIAGAKLLEEVVRF